MESAIGNQAGHGRRRNEQKPKRTVKSILLFVVVLALVLGGGYLYQRHKLSSYFDQVVIPNIREDGRWLIKPGMRATAAILTAEPKADAAKTSDE